jgi:sugar phosphate permease
VSSTAAPARRYRWTILSAGVVAQAANSAILLGLPSIAPALREHYGLTLPQVGVVLAALNFGSVGTLLLWGVVADRIGERAVIALGQTAAAAGLLWAGRSSSFATLVAALSVTGAVGAGVNAASGRAVMTWFGEDERGFALGIRQMAVPLGGALAAIALPLLNAHISLRAAFDGLATGCVLAAVVGATLLRPEPTDDHSLLARPLRDPRVWRICIASVFYVLTQLSLIGFFVLFLHDRRGVSTGVAAGGLAATQVLGGVARIVVGRLSDLLRLLIAARSPSASPLRSVSRRPFWMRRPGSSSRHLFSQAPSPSRGTASPSPQLPKPQDALAAAPPSGFSRRFSPLAQSSDRSASRRSSTRPRGAWRSRLPQRRR